MLITFSKMPEGDSFDSEESPSFFRNALYKHEACMAIIKNQKI